MWAGFSFWALVTMGWHPWMDGRAIQGVRMVGNGVGGRKRGAFGREDAAVIGLATAFSDSPPRHRDDFAGSVSQPSDFC